MRRGALILVLACGCATRAHPVRFAAPMLGIADVPPPPLAGPRRPEARDEAHDEAHPRTAADVGSALPPAAIASGAAAEAIQTSPTARLLAHLPIRHRLPRGSLPPPVRTPLELRGLVGRRDTRDRVAVAIGWARELGTRFGDDAPGPDLAALLAWAERHHRLRGRDATPAPGDLLVFERRGLVGVVIARDPRGVTEFAYVGGGVIRRGFVDASRPSQRRDGDGAIVNTHLRHDRREPARGTRDRAGELLSHVVASGT